jgi:hypothetical protein
VGRTKTWRQQKLLGKGVADKMHQIVLEIGEDVWTRQELIEQLRCGHFRAAMILSEAVRELQPKNLRELMARVTIYDLFELRGVGTYCGFVWLCALEAAGVNPLGWLRASDPEETGITLPSYKLRTIKAAEEREFDQQLREKQQREKVTPMRKRA